MMSAPLVRMICLLLMLAKTGISQDLHFSQFYNTPLYANPAYTGFLPDTDYRLGISYRQQFANILPNPYRTFSAYGDAVILQNRFDYAWAGVGGLLLNDVAGTGNFRTTKAYLSLAYHQMLGGSSLLSAGCNIGWVTKSLDPSKFTFPDQFNGHFFDGSLPTGSVISRSSVSYPDLQVGLNYSYFASDDIYLSLGYKLANALKPKESFFSGSYNERVNHKHTGFFNAIIKTNSTLIIQPSMLYSSQAGAISWMAGTQVRLQISKEKDASFHTGIFWRNNDAIIPSVGLQIRRISFNFSYDVTNSGLRNFNNGAGATEFNLNTLNNIGEKPSREFSCPHF
jgi:type IX secretion system PorP/SprF family membrane protein